MNQNHSSIWYRTLAYLGSAFVVFFVVVLALLWFVGGERSASEVLLADAKRLAALEEQWIEKAEAARSVGPEALDAYLRERAEAAGSRRALARQIESLQTAPKNGNNQQEIRDGIAAGYASLQEGMPGPDPFTRVMDGAKRSIVFAFLIVFAALSGIVVILFRMIVGPLENIVRNARRVSEGELDIKFSLKTDDELGQLSRVMDNLTTNFRELLTLMQSSCATGIQLTTKLTGESSEDGSQEDRAQTAKKLEDVFLKMREITEYFRQG